MHSRVVVVARYARGFSTTFRLVDCHRIHTSCTTSSASVALPSMRVSAQLTDAVSGTQLWAEAFGREINDAGTFQVQDDLTDHIVTTVADGTHRVRACLAPLCHHATGRSPRACRASRRLGTGSGTRAQPRHRLGLSFQSLPIGVFRPVQSA